MAVIRPAGREDCEAIRRLLQDLYLELGEEAESVEFLTWELVLRAIEGPTTALLAFDDEDLVAIATVTETSAIYAGGSYGVIDEMYVLPAHRSRKIGERLIEASLDLARARGWKRLDVTGPTEADRWARTIRFYESNGFTFTGNKLKLEV